MDPVTVRRPLIMHDSTFDYRPTSWPGMLLNNQDKKVRYQLINYERPVKHFINLFNTYTDTIKNIIVAIVAASEYLVNLLLQTLDKKNILPVF